MLPKHQVHSLEATLRSMFGTWLFISTQGRICLLMCRKTDAWRKLTSSWPHTEGRLELYTGILVLQFITKLRDSLCCAVLFLLSEEKFRCGNEVMRQVLVRSKTVQDLVLGESLIICFFSAVCFSCMYGSTALVKINRFVNHMGEILTQLKSMGDFFPLTSPEPGFKPK